MSESVSYSDSISKLSSALAKVSVSILYAPLVGRYRTFKKALGKAQEQEEEELDALIDALDIFSNTDVKESVHDRTVEFSSFFLDEDTNFFDDQYPNLSHIAERHRPGSELVQSLRKKVLSFFQILDKDLSEMGKERKKIDRGIERMDTSSTSSLLRGLRNAAVGASAGSIVPILGTAGGAAMGLFATDYKQTQERNSEQEQVLESVQKYISHVESIMNKLGKNADELYAIFEQTGELVYKKIPKKIYLDLDRKGHDADLIIKKYYDYNLSKTQELFDKSIDESDPNSPTLRDLTTGVNDFIKDREQEANTSSNKNEKGEKHIWFCKNCKDKKRKRKKRDESLKCKKCGRDAVYIGKP